MSPARGARLSAAGMVVLGCAGTWVAHTVEYARVWGVRGLETATFGAAHLYMLPLAAALAGLGALGALRLRAARAALRSRLLQARRSRLSLWRGRPAPSPPPPAGPPSAAAGLISLWLPLAAAQLCLYLIQENVEALPAGLPAPGLGAITGVHWAAAIVHLCVALVLAAAVRVVQRRMDRVAAAVARVEALVRRLAGRHRLRAPAPPARCRRAAGSPLERLGGHLWRRPPPAPVAG
jgi:hypothetical protein